MGALIEGGAVVGHISGSSGSPATVHYAGHVGVGMLVVLTLYDPAGAVWSPTGVTDSAGNTYNPVLGAAGDAYYGSGAHNDVSPGTPFYIAQFPGVWVFDCFLTHAVDASTVLTVGLSAAATFYVNGTQFAALVGPAAISAIVDNSTPAAALFVPPFGVWNIPIELIAASPAPNSSGVGLTGAVFPQSTVPIISGETELYTVAPHLDGSADGHLVYTTGDPASEVYTTNDVNPLSSDPTYALVVGRAFGLAYDGTDAPSSSLDAAYTLTGHTVSDDVTLGAGGKRLDMTFESNGSWNAGAGYTATCLSGDSTQQLPSWWDWPVALFGVTLASTLVNTGTGPQPLTALLEWWRALVAEPSLDPSVMGPATLMDLTVLVDTTQTATLHKPCDGSVVTGLSQDIQIFDNSGLPTTSGPISAGSFSEAVGDTFVDGALTGVGVPLGSTVLGHELGFRVWHQHTLPWFIPNLGVYAMYPGSQWNTMTAHVTLKVAMWFRPPYVDPVSPDDTFTQPDDGPGPDVSPGGGGPPPGGIASAIAIGEPLSGLREGV